MDISCSDLKIAIEEVEPPSLDSEGKLKAIGEFSEALSNFKDKYTSLAARYIHKPATQSEEERETTLQLLDSAKDLMFMENGKSPYPILAILPSDTPLLSFAKLWLFGLAKDSPLLIKPASCSLNIILEIANLINTYKNSLRILEQSGFQIEPYLPGNDLKLSTVYAGGWKSTIESIAEALNKKFEFLNEYHISTVAVATEKCDVDQVIGETIQNSFEFNGQYCSAQRGLLVHESLFDVISTKLKARLDLFVKPFSPEHDDSTVTEQFDRTDESDVYEAISDSIAEGAEVIAGGPSSENIFYPTVVAGLRPERKLVTDDFRAPYLWFEKYDTHPDEYLSAVKKEKRVVIYGENSTLKGRLEATLNWEVVNRTDIEAVLPHQWTNPLSWLSVHLGRPA